VDGLLEDAQIGVNQDAAPLDVWHENIISQPGAF
jgi:hypothetical protein